MLSSYILRTRNIAPLLLLVYLLMLPPVVFATDGSVDHIRITVYYTEAAVPDISVWGVIGFTLVAGALVMLRNIFRKRT